MSEARRQLFVIPDPQSLHAPSQLIRLFHIISDELLDSPEHVTRPEGVRTIRISDGFPYDTRPVSEELNTVLFSFHTDPADVGRYTPPEWRHVATFTLNATRRLTADSRIGQDTLYIFVDDGYTHIFYPEGKDDRVMSRRTGWKPAILRFLEEQGSRILGIGAQMTQSGHLNENIRLLDAGKHVVAMSRRMTALIKLLDPDIGDRNTEDPWSHSLTTPTIRAHRIGL